MYGYGYRVNESRSLWTPHRIVTLAWYDASESSTIAEIGGSVSQWDDRSGNGYDLTQGVGTSQPSYSGNGIVHTGVQRLQTTANVPINNDFTIIEVKEYSDVTEGINTTSTTAGTFIRSAGLGYERNGWAATPNNNTGGTAQTNDNIAILSQALENGVGGNYWTDGEKEDAFTDVTNSRSTLAYLKTANTTIVSSYTLYELIVFSRKLTDEELDLVHGYLAWKWSGAL